MVQIMFGHCTQFIQCKTNQCCLILNAFHVLVKKCLVDLDPLLKLQDT